MDYFFLRLVTLDSHFRLSLVTDDRKKTEIAENRNHWVPAASNNR